MEAAGCYGRNGADDVAADAALLSRAVGAPVRVQLTREQENLWEPKGAAQLMQVRGGLDADGAVAAYDFHTCYPSNARADAGAAADAHHRAGGAGLRDGRPHRASALRRRRTCASRSTTWRRSCAPRGCAACRRCPIPSRTSPTSTSWPRAAGADPVAVPPAPPARPARRRTAARHRAIAPAGGALQQPQQQPPSGDRLHGQGVAYARYVHSKWPGFGAAWSAWVADVEVNRRHRRGACARASSSATTPG